LYPNAKFICLHRHALDVVHSGMERSKYGLSHFHINEGYHTSNLHNFIEILSESWIQKTYALLDFEANVPNQCFRVTYEALVTNTQVVLQDLCSFLNIPWEVELLEKVFNGAQSPHEKGSLDPNITMSTSITQNIGKGENLPFTRISQEHLKKINHLHRALSYPLVESVNNFIVRPYAYLFDEVGLKEGEEQKQFLKEFFKTFVPNKLIENKETISSSNAIIKFNIVTIKSVESCVSI